MMHKIEIPSSKIKSNNPLASPSKASSVNKSNIKNKTSLDRHIGKRKTKLGVDEYEMRAI